MLVYNEMSDTYNAANVVESGKILLVHKLNSYINAYLFFFNQYRIVHRSTQPALSPDFQETVRTSVESEPYELVQKTPPTLPSPLQILRKSLQPSLRLIQLESPVFRL